MAAAGTLTTVFPIVLATLDRFSGLVGDDLLVLVPLSMPLILRPLLLETRRINV